jgi:hypothetical protein
MEKLGTIASRAIDTALPQRTPEQAYAFEAECAAYDAAIDQAKAEVFKMVSHMPAPGVDQDPRTAAAVYWDFLKHELSPENIVLVCRAAMRGDVNPDSDFRPIVARLISYGRKHFQWSQPIKRDPRIANPIKPKLLPEHEQLSAHESARIGDKMRELAREIRADSAEPMRLSKEALSRIT